MFSNAGARPGAEFPAERRFDLRFLAIACGFPARNVGLGAGRAFAAGVLDTMRVREAEAAICKVLAVDSHGEHRPGVLEPFDRRSFLDAVLAVGFVTTAAAIVYPVARFLVPPPTVEPDTASAVAGRAAALRPKAAIIFRFGNKPAIVVRTAEGELHAFSAVCTHLDCTVQFKPDTSLLWCACHNGLYDLGGNVVSGPPPRPLEKFVVRLRGEPGEEEIVVARA